MKDLLLTFSYLGGLAALLFLSGFFSGSETALFSLSRTQARRMRNGSLGERFATRLLLRPRQLLSSLLLGNMLVNVMAASLVAGLARHWCGNHGVGVAIAVSSVLLVVFGEVTPKTLAVRHARAFARVVAGPLWVFSRLTAPIRAAVVGLTNLLLRFVGLHNVPGWGTLTRTELQATLALGESHGATNGRERQIAEQILGLSALDAHDLMLPRTEVHGIDDRLTAAQAFDAVCRSGLDRVPVYHEDLDDIWGFIAVVDLPRWRGRPEFDRPLATFRATDARPEPGPDHCPVYPIHVFPETSRIETLLRQMRRRRAPFAVLLDEYGGTAGVLTVDDILAELMGRVPGETGTAAEPCLGPAQKSISVDGRTPLRSLNRRLPYPLPRRGPDTLGGYAMDRLGRIPRAGDEIEDERYRFTVLRMAGRRIGALRIEQIGRRAAVDGEDAP